MLVESYPNPAKFLNKLSLNKYTIYFFSEISGSKLLDIINY